MERGAASLVGVLAAVGAAGVLLVPLGSLAVATGAPTGLVLPTVRSLALALSAGSLATLLALGAGLWLRFLSPWRPRVPGTLMALSASLPSVGVALVGVWFVSRVPWAALPLVGLLMAGLVVPLALRRLRPVVQAVPQEQVDAALALGASPVRAVVAVVLPAMGQGVLAAFLSGTGRALGDTMVALLVLGAVGGGVDTLTTRVVGDGGGPAVAVLLVVGLALTGAAEVLWPSD